MSILSAGKGHTKYNIHLSNKKISKNTLNKFLSNKNKVLIITDSGVPKKFLKSLKKDINTKHQYSMILEKGEKSKSFKLVVSFEEKIVVSSSLKDVEGKLIFKPGFQKSQ